jgi:hypothetical protein
MRINRRKFLYTAALTGGVAALLPLSSCLTAKREAAGYPDYIKTYKVLF